MTQVLHSTDVVVAALAYAGDLMRLRSWARLRAGGDAGGDSGEEGASGAPGLDAAAAGADAGTGRETLQPHAAGQPHSLRERVLQAFSTHDLPVHKPLSLPTLSLELACPGEGGLKKKETKKFKSLCALTMHAARNVVHTSIAPDTV